jgi:hypothetical protein
VDLIEESVGLVLRVNTMKLGYPVLLVTAEMKDGEGRQLEVI